MLVPFLSFPSLVLNVICSARSSFKIKILLRDNTSSLPSGPGSRYCRENNPTGPHVGEAPPQPARRPCPPTKEWGEVWSGGRGQFSADSDPTQVGISAGDPDEGGFLSSPTAAQVHPGSPLSHLCREGGFPPPSQGPGWV